MRRAGLVLVCVAFVAGISGVAGAQDPNAGWKLPAGAATEQAPFPTTDAVVAAGLKIYTARCARCHGVKGLGDGADADIDLQEKMDLTRPDRAAANPNGVVFHKVWNGRSEPRMPSFQDQLTREQAWAVVAYAQTLRRK